MNEAQETATWIQILMKPNNNNNSNDNNKFNERECFEQRRKKNE